MFTDKIMPNILHIETSTSVCSAALSSDGVVQCHFENFDGPSHASLLGAYVKELMTFARDKSIKVDAVAVSSGPGSYTGLRIGVSEAKGLCFGLKVPLIAVHTLELLACATMFKTYFDEDVLYCPMIDARRMEVYTAVYDNALNAVRPVQACVVDENSFADLLADRRVVFSATELPSARRSSATRMPSLSTTSYLWLPICWHLLSGLTGKVSLRMWPISSPST